MTNGTNALSSGEFTDRQQNWHRWPSQRIGEALQARGLHPEDKPKGIPAHAQRAGRFVFSDLPSLQPFLEKDISAYLRFHMLARRGPDEPNQNDGAGPIIYPGVQAINEEERSPVFSMKWEPIPIGKPTENDTLPGTSGIVRDTAYLFCSQFCACPDQAVGSLFETSYGTAHLRVNHFDFRNPATELDPVRADIRKRVLAAALIALNFGESTPFREHPFRIRPILEITSGKSNDDPTNFEYSMPCPPFCD